MRCLVFHTMVLTTLAGCSPHESIQHYLEGDWIAVQYPPPYEYFPGYVGMSFKGDSVEILESARVTSYRLQGRQIHLEMREGGDEWTRTLSVSHISEESLVVLIKGKAWTFEKLHMNRNERSVENLRFVSYPCFGRCPAGEAILDHQGWFWYRWDSRTTESDNTRCYVGRLSESGQRYIFEKVAQADLPNAESYYRRPDAPPHAGKEESVEIRYDTGEERLISSHMDSGPPGLEWLHVALRELPRFAGVLASCDSISSLDDGSMPMWITQIVERSTVTESKTQLP